MFGVIEFENARPSLATVDTNAGAAFVPGVGFDLSQQRQPSSMALPPHAVRMQTLSRSVLTSDVVIAARIIGPSQASHSKPWPCRTSSSISSVWLRLVRFTAPWISSTTCGQIS
jgi:hypothetical protein